MSSQSSDNNDNNSSSVPQRRASITEYFRPPQPSSAYPGPITTAAAQANHRRRMSFSGGVTGTSPNPAWFGSYSARRGSISSISSTASSPVIGDDEEKSPVDATSSSSGSFARRLSFGARALRDVKKSMSFGTVGEGEPEHQHQDDFPRQSTVPDAIPPPPAPAAAPNRAHDEDQERMLKGDFYF